jgi:DNA-binding winged helix-turn-helix (wHTH) protein
MVGEWTVLPELNSLERNERTVHLEPKVMQVLSFLAQHHGELVSKERLIQAVWADAFVTDEVLTRCISELRRTLSDDPKKPKFIETIPKSGYRAAYSSSREPKEKVVKESCAALALADLRFRRSVGIDDLIRRSGLSWGAKAIRQALEDQSLNGRNIRSSLHCRVAAGKSFR